MSVKHRDFYKELRDYQRELRRRVNSEESELAKQIKDPMISRTWIENRKAELKAHRQALIPSLKDWAAHIREQYRDALKDDYSPSRMKVSDNIANAINSQIDFSAEEWGLLMSDAKTDGDRRAIRDAAARKGVHVSGYISLDERLAMYDRYVDCLTKVDGELSEVAPQAYQKMLEEEAFEIFKTCESYPPVAAFPVPKDFSSVGEAIAIEKAAERTNDISGSELRRAEDAFREAAQIDKTTASAAREDDARAKAAISLQKHKERKAEAQRQVMEEALNNADFERSMKELSARQAAEEAEAAKAISDRAAAVSAAQAQPSE